MQVCWEKFTRYFDVEERFVHLTNDCFVLTPEKAIELVDENTIGRPQAFGFPSARSVFGSRRRCIAVFRHDSGQVTCFVLPMVSNPTHV